MSLFTKETIAKSIATRKQNAKIFELFKNEYSQFLLDPTTKKILISLYPDSQDDGGCGWCIQFGEGSPKYFSTLKQAIDKANKAGANFSCPKELLDLSSADVFELFKAKSQ